MTTVNDDDPILEWCEHCQRPAELCECEPPTEQSVDGEPEPSEHPTEHRDVERLNTDGDATERRIEHGLNTGLNTAVNTGGWRSRGWAWLSQWGALIPIWLLAGALGAAGFAVSFVTVEAKMTPYFGELAWLVPAATDLGIIVFTLLDIVLARRSMRIPWMRYIPWASTAATIYLNVTAYTALEAQAAHAVLPSLWGVFSEAIARIMKLKAKEEFQVTRTVPLIRWVCAPVATLILWRAMQLWNIATYDEALRREEERQLAKALIKAEVKWVKKAPPALRERYRQRKITTADMYAAIDRKN